MRIHPRVNSSCRTSERRFVDFRLPVAAHGDEVLHTQWHLRMMSEDRLEVLSGQLSAPGLPAVRRARTHERPGQLRAAWPNEPTIILQC